MADKEDPMGLGMVVKGSLVVGGIGFLLVMICFGYLYGTSLPKGTKLWRMRMWLLAFALMMFAPAAVLWYENVQLREKLEGPR